VLGDIGRDVAAAW